MSAELAPSVEDALQERDFARVRAVCAEQLAPEVAEIIEGLEPELRAILFRLLPRDQAAESFEYLEPDTQEGLIKAMAREQVAAILNDMAPDNRTALLEELPAAVTRQLLSLLTPDERKIAVQLLGYPEDSIGRLMTPELIALDSGWTVAQSLDHVRHHGEDSETLNVLYVVDERNKLVDDLRMRQLLLADPQSHISDLMDGHFVALKAIDDQEAAVPVFTEYDRVAFPVIDSNGVLLGVVTVDDVLDVIEEEATEDIQKIGGMQALEQPYMQASYGEMLRKRASWLVLLFLGQLLTINAIAFFQGWIEQALFLSLFVPLIISSGGNSGSQAATLVVRAMALDEVSVGDWWKVLRREILFGVTLGAILASIGFARIMLDPGLSGPKHDGALVAIVVGGSLVGVVVWGVLIGSMLPFALRGLGADPATSSTPFVATIVDVTGLVIYLSVATAVLF